MLMFQPKNSKGTCAYCMVDVGRKNVKLCVRCRLVRYCSRDCQKKSWPTHKRFCSSEALDILAQDPALEIVHDALSKWIYYWRETLHRWSLWALDLPNHPEDRLSTHCFSIQLEMRRDPPSVPGQSFRMVGGDVLTREEIISILVKLEMPQHSIHQWANDRRGDNTVQIVIVCENLIQFMWFSLRDLQSLRPSLPAHISRALAENWDDALAGIIESGDPSKSIQHVLEINSRF